MIDLVFCGNEKVFDGILTALLSIAMRDPSKDAYRVTVLTMDLTRRKPDYTPISDRLCAFLDKVLKTYNPESSVRKVDVTDLYEEHLGHGPNENTYVSPYALLRLLIDLVPGFDHRVLYLDVDLFFNRDIHLLYDYPIDRVEYAAANDHYGKFLINPRYINSGVILFNLDRCRETNLLGKARQMVATKKLMFPDQSAIYKCTTRKKLLPPKYNDQKFLHKKSTIVRHFSKRLFWLPYPHTANIKQWMVDDVHRIFRYHAWDDVYEEYFRLKAEYEKGE